MKRLLIIALFSLTTPLVTLAQTPATTGGQQTLQGFIKNFVLFLNGTIVPFLLGLGFLLFVINVVRFFVLQSNNEDGQKAAKALALYSILAFVIVIIFWGLVNMLAYTLGLQTGGPPTSDYVDQTQEPGTVPPPRDQRNRTNTQTTPTSQNTPPSTNFAPPSDWQNTPPPISDELEGEPDPFLFGSPEPSNL